jgi:hypothetical protein
MAAPARVSAQHGLQELLVGPAGHCRHSVAHPCCYQRLSTVLGVASEEHCWLLLFQTVQIRSTAAERLLFCLFIYQDDGQAYICCSVGLRFAAGAWCGLPGETPSPELALHSSS